MELNFHVQFLVFFFFLMGICYIPSPHPSPTQKKKDIPISMISVYTPVNTHLRIMTMVHHAKVHDC